MITTKRANKDKISVEYNGTLTFDTQLAKWDEVQQIYGMGSNGTYSYDAISNTNKSWGPKADGSNMLKYFMNGARLGIAAQSVGVSEAAYREAIAYARDRKQFGQAIIEFPAVFDRCV